MELYGLSGNKPTTYSRTYDQPDVRPVGYDFEYTMFSWEPDLLYNVHWRILYHLPSVLNMLLLFAEGIALYGVSWVLWRIFGRFIVRSPLDNIPGPPSKSWWKGVNKQTELHIKNDSN